MVRLISILLLIHTLGVVQAQNTLKVFLKDEETEEPLVFASVIIENSKNGVSSDTTGFAELMNIPDGRQTIIFSYVGYRPREKTFTFPLKQKKSLVVYLEKAGGLDEVVVYSTRTNNRIKEIPTRIEVLGHEEVVEVTAISPGNISKLLGETSGIQVQSTSAISGNVSFRIQGLPGKYTQLLQDGFPVYGGFSSGLSLLQIPPLDLQQVEIVKGSASTLYGADAIAGIVNLITKKPMGKPELSILLNQTHKGETGFNSYYKTKKNKLGLTVLTGLNMQKGVDICGNSFADLPSYKRAVFSPKLFYDFNKNNRLYIGLSTVFEDRMGGDIDVINGKSEMPHVFYERNKTKRINTQLKYENSNPSGNVFAVKASYGVFDRKMTTNTNGFSGVQNSIFTELSYFVNSKKHKLVSGINFYSDDFQQAHPDVFSLNYSHQTIGAFAQDYWEVSDKVFLEPGIRYDYNIQNGGFFLPRLALMYKFNTRFFTRLSGGAGYKLPTPFSGDAERLRYKMVIMPADLHVEKSKGANLDFNFKTPLFEELFLNVNQSFFITDIENPIIANEDSLQNQVVAYENAQGAISSRGLNTNIRLRLDEFVLYVNYTYLDAQKTYDNNNQLEFTPGNRLTSTLAYEDEKRGWRTGLEAFYFGRQFRGNGDKTNDYWMLAVSVMKKFGHFKLALNVENILDIRQTRFENIVSGPPGNPVFNELYAPLNGIVANAVIKIDLF